MEHIPVKFALLDTAACSKVYCPNYVRKAFIAELVMLCAHLVMLEPVVYLIERNAYLAALDSSVVTQLLAKDHVQEVIIP